jgi:lipopolysaccharide/colanic/teichoic acid biosynthesis glycosyltransferase
MQNNCSEVVEIALNQKVRTPDCVPRQTAASKVATVPLWKRGLDVAIILMTAPITLLVGAVVALIIKFGSPGPVIFKQERVGYKGKRFICFKFRTMHVGAETGSHQGHTAQLIKSSVPMTKLDSIKDNRIIPFGSILRATGLDELPQLINVLRGEMSVVGPRPCVGYEFEMYEEWQKRRFDALPGLTGLWQVSGKNRTTFNQMINLDIEYSERANLWLDLRIIFKTVPALVIQCCDQRAKRKQAQKAGQQIKVDSQSPSVVPSRVNVAG